MLSSLYLLHIHLDQDKKHVDYLQIFKVRGHSITTWTRRGGEGVSQMSTIFHAREGGHLRNVHVDKIFGKMQFFAASVIGRLDMC